MVINRLLAQSLTSTLPLLVVKTLTGPWYYMGVLVRESKFSDEFASQYNRPLTILMNTHALELGEGEKGRRSRPSTFTPN